jgi:hypothetical protein
MVLNASMDRKYVDIAFKKAWHPWLDNWTALFIWIKSGFKNVCHVEIAFSNGQSWSSEPQYIEDNTGKKKHGVRFKRISYSHRDWWFFVRWDLNDPRFKQYTSEQALYDECKKLVGCGYDFLGCFGEAIDNNNVQDNSDYYCSEAVATVMGIKPAQIKPSELMAILKG